MTCFVCFFVQAYRIHNDSNGRKILVYLLIRINTDVKFRSQSKQVSSGRRRKVYNGCILGIFNEINIFSIQIQILSLFVLDYCAVSQWIWIAFFI